MAVKLTSFGSETRDVPFVEGQTASQYLAEHDIELAPETTLSVNGEPADSDAVVEDESVVVVAPKIANG